jgi:hypothetical protein
MQIEDFFGQFRPRCAQYQATAIAMGRSEHAVVVRTTKITIETESLLVVRKGRTVVTWCPTCCAQAEVMTLECDSLGRDILSALFTDWLAAGKLHSWSPDGGPTQICMKSLLQYLESEDARTLPNPNQLSPKTGEEE